MRRLGLAIALLLTIAVVPVVTSAAPRSKGSAPSDIRHFDPEARRELVVSPRAAREIRESVASRPGARAAVVGDERIWLAIDDAEGAIFPKAYTLRGIGDHIEVWVASDADDVSTGTEFPPGDCRNDGVRTVITDEQVQYLISEFDGSMYPIESEAFSIPPSRNGRNAPITSDLGLPANYYRGSGDRIVVLIDNVRDENFYDTDNANGLPYIAGFYFSLFDDLFNRLVMSIDAFDWLHRTGANPPNEPSADLCANAAARPFLYEGVFAHEYQHLLENYADFDETIWVNEGLSTHASVITGYVDPAASINEARFESGVQCFLGWLAVQTPVNPIPDEGGPENSLTVWGDQTDFPSEILCDYGAALSFMEYLAGRFGPDLMTGLHLGEENGLASLAVELGALAADTRVLGVIKSWATMVAVDAALDDGWTLVGGEPEQFSTPTLNAEINWDNEQAFAGPGVPPNGSDYVRLRDATGTSLGVAGVDSIGFDGASELPPLPVAWKVDRTPPGGAQTALYSGQGDNLDRAIAQRVRVGANGRLEIRTAWDTEEGYDYAYVQVSNDGGETYRSVRCTDSIDAPLGPGFEGDSGGFVDQRCNLRRYAGDRVILAFRYVTDAGVVSDGFWIDDVLLDGRLISTGNTLRGWRTPTQINPVDVKAWHVRLVAFDETRQEVRLATLALDGEFEGSLSGAELDALIGTTGSTVAAIVTFLDRSETVLHTAAYTLTVNGVDQPGG